MDLVANAKSLGALTFKADSLAELRQALEQAKGADRTTVIVVETDPSFAVPGYESWWDVPPAEISEMESVREARQRYDAARLHERRHF